MNVKLLWKNRKEEKINNQNKFSKFIELLNLNNHGGKVLFFIDSSSENIDYLFDTAAEHYNKEESGKKIGYSSDRYPFFKNSTLNKEIEYIKAMTGSIDDALLAKAIEYFKLENLLDSKLGALPGCQLQKINLIQAFILRPDILFLNNSLRDFDQEASDQFSRFFTFYKNQYLEKGTVVIGSTKLTDVNSFCDKVLTFKK